MDRDQLARTVGGARAAVFPHLARRQGALQADGARRGVGRPAAGLLDAGLHGHLRAASQRCRRTAFPTRSSCTPGCCHGRSSRPPSAASSQSLVNQQALLTKIYLPRLFVPSAVDRRRHGRFRRVVRRSSRCLMAYYGVMPGGACSLLPLARAADVVAALGVGSPRRADGDVPRLSLRHADFMVQVWMYLSPVIYPVTWFPRSGSGCLPSIPWSGSSTAFALRSSARPWNLTALAISASSSRCSCWSIGLFYFRRTERRFADVA